MKTLLLFSSLCTLSVLGFGQRSLVSSQKTHTAITPMGNVVRGGANNGETCATAIGAVVGVNAADGPSSGAGCYNCSDVAANADWFIYQPASAGKVSLSTCLGGVDTRLWVYESEQANCAELTEIAANDDFCELTGGGDEYASYVEFTVCAGKTYYFEWDDEWDPSAFSFTMTFTPIVGAEIAVMGGSITEYTRMPRSAGVLDITADYKNQGAVAITNVTAEVSITKNGSPFSSNTDAETASFATCMNDSYTYTALAQDVGDYTAQLEISGTEIEADMTNNVISQSFSIDTSFARDNGTSLGSFGIGLTGVMGHTFFLPKPDKLTSVSFKLGGAVIAGSSTRVDIYATDGTGKPTTLLGSTPSMDLDVNDTSAWITLPIVSGPITLPAGGFFIGFVESVDDTIVPMGINDVLYTPMRAWVNIPGTTTGFQNIEDFGFGGFSFLLRANFGQTYAWSSVEEPIATTADIKLMPNPTAGIFTLALDNAADKTRITILDATGKTVKDEIVYTTASLNHSIDLSAYAQGVYTVRVVSGNRIINRKLVLAH